MLYPLMRVTSIREDTEKRDEKNSKENKNRIIRKRIGIKVRQDMSYVSSCKKSRDEVGGTLGKKERKVMLRKMRRGVKWSESCFMSASG